MTIFCFFLPRSIIPSSTVENEIGYADTKNRCWTMMNRPFALHLSKFYQMIYTTK